MEGVPIKLLKRNLFTIKEFIIKMFQLYYVHYEVEVGIKILKDNIILINLVKCIYFCHIYNIKSEFILTYLINKLMPQ